MTRCAALLWALACAPPCLAQTRSVSGELAVSTDLTERGAFVGERRPVAQAAVSLYDATGWSLGGALAVNRLGLRGSRVVLRAAHEQPLPQDWQGQLALQYYAYPADDAGRGFDRWEAAGTLSWRDRVVLGVTAFHYLHPATGTPALRWALDAGTRWPLTSTWSAQAALGLAAVQHRGHYTYASLGLAWQSSPWRAEANLLGASPAARRFLPSSTPGHLSLAVTRMF